MIHSTAVKFLCLKNSRDYDSRSKLELGHIAPVHSATCVRYPDRLLLQNTIYLVNKSLLNTKIHLPAWQQLTDCETNVNPDQTFCFGVLLADVMRLLRIGHCACLAGSDMRSSCADGSNMILYLAFILDDTVGEWHQVIDLFSCIKTPHVMILDCRFICVKLAWFETSNGGTCNDRWEGPDGESLPMNTWKHRAP